MTVTLMRRVAVIGASAALTAIGLAFPASASAFEVTFPAGLVCSFPLVVAGSGDGSQVSKNFYDKDGNLRTLSAGTGFELTFTNGDTAASFSTASNGAVVTARYAADGSSTQFLTGHNAVFLFPTDIPGASATLYTGRVVINIDSLGTWTIRKESGQKVDLCAELSADA